MGLFAVLLGLFLATVAGTAYAYDPLTTEEAYPLASRQVEVDMNYSYSASFGQSRTHTLLFSPSLGIGGRLEFDIDIPFIVNRDKAQPTYHGVGDIRAATKVSLLREKRRAPAFTIEGFFKFDTGSGLEGLGTGSREAGFLGIVSKEIGAITLHGMIGLDFIVSGNQQGRRAVIYGGAVVYQVGNLCGRPTYLMTEVFGNANVNPAIAFSPASWLFGFSHDLSPNWSVGSALTMGLTGSGTSLNATAGASFLFPNSPGN